MVWVVVMVAVAVLVPTGVQDRKVEEVRSPILNEDGEGISMQRANGVVVGVMVGVEKTVRLTPWLVVIRVGRMVLLEVLLRCLWE